MEWEIADELDQGWTHALITKNNNFILKGKDNMEDRRYVIISISLFIILLGTKSESLTTFLLRKDGAIQWICRLWCKLDTPLG